MEPLGIVPSTTLAEAKTTAEKRGEKKANGRKKIKQQQQQPLVAIRGRLAIDAAAASERGGVKEGIYSI